MKNKDTLDYTQEAIHPDLLEVQNIAYTHCRLVCSHYRQEDESREYGACDFLLNQRSVKFRVGKITPTKIGQFVTLWKRIGSGPIQPFDISDPFDLYVVNVRTSSHFGQFVFPKDVLREKGVLSDNGKGGKLAMRVYPPWDRAENSQAKKTQAWQLLYFFEIERDKPLDKARIQQLY